MKKTVIELFAGVGGFRVGLNHISSIDKNGMAIEKNDWEFVFSNQWEPATTTQDAFKCYEKRFGQQHEFANTDICKVDTKDIPDATLLVGGFPCQDYSVASTLINSKGIEGKKGVLFWEIKRILEDKKIPFFLLENVDRLLISPNKQKGRDFAIMLKVFQKLGYLVQWRVINAANYGSVQKRKRIFIFGSKIDTNYSNESIKNININPYDFLKENSFFSKVFPFEKSSLIKEIKLGNKISNKEIIEISNNFSDTFLNNGLMINGNVYMLKVDNSNNFSLNLSSIRDNKTDKTSFYLNDDQIEKFKFQKGSKKIKRVDKKTGYEYFYSEGQMTFPDDWNKPGRTLLTSETNISRSTHVVQDKNGFRFLTPIETERMQSFPDDWTNTGMTLKKRYFMMGNALVTLLISKMEKELTEIISKEK